MTPSISSSSENLPRNLAIIIKEKPLEKISSLKPEGKIFCLPPQTSYRKDRWELFSEKAGRLIDEEEKRLASDEKTTYPFQADELTNKLLKLSKESFSCSLPQKVSEILQKIITPPEEGLGFSALEERILNFENLSSELDTLSETLSYELETATGKNDLLESSTCAINSLIEFQKISLEKERRNYEEGLKTGSKRTLDDHAKSYIKKMQRILTAYKKNTLNWTFINRFLINYNEENEKKIFDIQEISKTSPPKKTSYLELLTSILGISTQEKEDQKENQSLLMEKTSSCSISYF